LLFGKLRRRAEGLRAEESYAAELKG